VLAWAEGMATRGGPDADAYAAPARSFDPREPGELCDRTAVDNSTLSHMLRRFEQGALIVRERAKDDERPVTLHLTRKGRKSGSSALPLAQNPSRIRPLNLGIIEGWTALIRFRRIINRRLVARPGFFP